jgi:hypothetical protein
MNPPPPAALGPATCLKCGHLFPPGTPEPCRCPDCHTLCSILDAPPKPPPMPEECPLTEAERARWRVWFWVLLLLGPAVALMAFPLGRAMDQALPSAWRPFFRTGGPLMALGLPVVAALGAAFCLARSQIAQRTTGELVLFTLMMSLLFIFTEAAILFVVGSAVIGRYFK